MGRKRKAPPAAPDKVEGMDYIAEPLRPLAMPIDQFVLDPANALKHTDKDLIATAASLRVYGQRTPIVVNETNKVVLKGNGTLQAAQRNGWTHLAVVFVKDDPATAAGYAIADNRTGRLAKWDEDAVEKLLHSIQTDDQDLAAMFDHLAQELDIVPEEEVAADTSPQLEGLEHRIVVDCKDEAHQAELLQRFETEGLTCRALIS